MRKERIWTEEVRRYLFAMFNAVTEYGTKNITKSGNITKDGARTITRLMQIRFPKPKEQERETFRIGNVTHALHFVTSGQNRSVFENSGYKTTFDKLMLSAMREGSVSGTEFAGRMTN